MNILFMGTPDFAVPSLNALYTHGHTILAVVTQPDKPRGRGYILTPPPVKVFATDHGIPVYQPETLKGGAFDSTVLSLHPDLIVVVAYGKILPPSILQAAPHGCINVHGSLLPALRGAAPMQRAIMDGHPTTGVTTMFMAEGLDTGDMLLTGEVPIEDDDNFESIHDKLAACGATVLLDTVAAIENGTLVRIPQNHCLATYAAKIEKSDCIIDFTGNARDIHNQIRGLSPMPLAFTHTPDGKMLKIVAARVGQADARPSAAPGTVIDTADGIEVACGHGTLILSSVKPEGKGTMGAADFVRGRKIACGDILS